MKSFTYALVGAASLLALPALAQSHNGNANAPSNNGSSTSAANPGTQMSQAQLTQLQQKITSDLQGDGYKDVRVVPNSFLVHATNKQGNAVVMIINPDSVFAVTELGANAANNSPNGAHSGSTGALGNSGNATPGNNSSNAR